MGKEKMHVYNANSFTASCELFSNLVKIDC